MEPLWGNMPHNLRSMYPMFMVLATFGFFPFTYYITWKLPDKSIRKYIIPYILVLLFSALWMPFCVQWLNQNSQIIWVAIRVILLLVAIGSLWIGALIYFEKEDLFHRKIALGGIFFFCIQTVVLDAFIWPMYL